MASKGSLSLVSTSGALASSVVDPSLPHQVGVMALFSALLGVGLRATKYGKKA